MDIDEKEMIVRFRRKRTKRKLLKVSAKEMARHIFCLVCENCEGCSTTHLSQTRHACLSMGKFKSPCNNRPLKFREITEFFHTFCVKELTHEKKNMDLEL